jgi:hypothetical protein
MEAAVESVAVTETPSLTAYLLIEVKCFLLVRLV